MAVLCPELVPAATRTLFVAGRGVDAVLLLAGAAAMALGRRVLIRRALLRRTASGATLPARLVAHELAHVAQFAAQGAVGFLAGYVAAYAAGLRGVRAVHRDAAYRAIPAEVLARQAEAAVQGELAFPVETV